MARGPDGQQVGSGRVGIFGGTFDPPHVGHVAVAGDVADALGLERVLWVPAGEPPHKTTDAVSPAEARLEMVQAAVAGDPRFVVDTLELERPGPSFMVETVRSLRDRYPEAELFLILGADQYAAFASWRAPQELAALVRLAVMDREGESARGLRPPLPGLGETVFVPVRRVDVSSTGVRDRIRRGEDVSGQLPRDVEAVIERLGLFRG